MLDTIDRIINYYNEYGNHALVQRLEYEFLQHKDLQEIRRYFEQNGGFAQNAWYPMWQAIFKSCDIENFLDIGVHTSQFSVFSKYLGQKFKKGVNVWSISPFTGLGDKYSEYEQKDYLLVFKRACEDLGFNFKDFNVIKGLSQDQAVKDQVKDIKYDCIYVDGDHSYNGVMNDIEYYVFELLAPGGLVVFDDALFYTPAGGHIGQRQGYPDVVQAVHELMDDNDEYELVCEVTHNRIFRRR